MNCLPILGMNLLSGTLGPAWAMDDAGRLPRHLSQSTRRHARTIQANVTDTLQTAKVVYGCMTPSPLAGPTLVATSVLYSYLHGWPRHNTNTERLFEASLDHDTMACAAPLPSNWCRTVRSAKGCDMVSDRHTIMERRRSGLVMAILLYI